MFCLENISILLSQSFTLSILGSIGTENTSSGVDISYPLVARMGVPDFPISVAVYPNHYLV